MKLKLAQFVGRNQLQTMRNLCRGEEGAHFVGKIQEMKDIIARMPKTYETEEQEKSAMVFLHYFSGSSDWWITERDSEHDQLQAFGMVSLHGCEPELGYINISELIAHGIELDLYWQPKTLEEISAMRQSASAA